MWITEIMLPAGDEVTRDADGFETHTKTYIEGIPASIKDTTRDDELLANQSGYRADVIVEIEASVYNGAGHFIDKVSGFTYDIVRTFKKERSNRIQLTGQRREHGKL